MPPTCRPSASSVDAQMTTEDPAGTKRRGRTKPLLIAVGIIAVVAVVLIGWTVWPRGMTEISHDEAVESFRNDTATANSPESVAEQGDVSEQSATGSDGAPTPEPGVYTYDASGSEQVKLGPFPTEERPLPGTVTIVVGDPTRGADGTCFEWTLNLFAEHTEATTWCVSPTNMDRGVPARRATTAGAHQTRPRTHRPRHPHRALDAGSDRHLACAVS